MLQFHFRANDLVFSFDLVLHNNFLKNENRVFLFEVFFLRFSTQLFEVNFFNQNFELSRFKVFLSNTIVLRCIGAGCPPSKSVNAQLAAVARELRVSGCIEGSVNRPSDRPHGLASPDLRPCDVLQGERCVRVRVLFGNHLTQISCEIVFLQARKYLQQ